MLPARLPTLPSPSMGEACRRSKLLYRDCLRSIPLLRERYQLDYDRRDIIHRFRSEWEKNRKVKDLPTVDALVWKGRFELDEMRNLWKQKMHVAAYFNPYDHRTHRSSPELRYTKFTPRPRSPNPLKQLLEGVEKEN